MLYLEKYSGEWTLDTAKQLLNRTVLGPSKDLILQSMEMGLDATIESLFSIPEITTPIKHMKDGVNGISDPEVKYGETWVEALINPNVSNEDLKLGILNYRQDSLAAWTIQQLFNQGISLKGKMWLFWHNHFVVASIDNPTRLYTYSKLIFENLLGNIKEFTCKMTLETSMLLYLSGSSNTNVAPNENYARELLELFTLGKGSQVEPGDYTTFSETDVTQGAKILTGWTVPHIDDINPLKAVFKTQLHTSGPKQLSHRFNHITIQESGDTEYKVYIDTIFNRLDCAIFITRKFFSYFINPNIDSLIEDNLILPLAEILFEDDYNVNRMLKTLLSSNYFYSIPKCIIRSPLEIVANATAGLDFHPSMDISESYEQSYNIYKICQSLNQWIYFHPTVAGWKAYYQKPQLDKAWINATSLPKRNQSLRIIIKGGEYKIENASILIEALYNPIDIIQQFEQAAYIEPLIKEIIDYQLIYGVNTDQVARIKERVMQGLPDFEWTIEYNSYINDPDNEDLKSALNAKLIILFSTIFSMPEYHIA